jgi:hypothetical protein
VCGLTLEMLESRIVAEDFMTEGRGWIVLKLKKKKKLHQAVRQVLCMYLMKPTFVYY